jgi:two-component system chemotaxis response regulator CheB
MRQQKCTAGVIVVSSFTVAAVTVQSRRLKKVCFDFIPNHQKITIEKNRTVIRIELQPKIRAFSRWWEIQSILKGSALHVSAGRKPNVESKELSSPLLVSNMPKKVVHPQMILIGVSTGGPAALSVIIPQIPSDINVPVFIVQHMPPMFTKALAESLQAKSKLKIMEAADGMKPQSGHVYIAPGGKQMKLVKIPDNTKCIQITDDPAENNCKPAVDYFFRSVANNFPAQSVAAILTGMGSDGTIGLKLLKRQGCQIIAQDEASCVVFGMPRSAIEAGVVDEVLPLDKIASRMTDIIKRGRI